MYNTANMPCAHARHELTSPACANTSNTPSEVLVKPPYDNPYGVWKVSTEDDIDGRSMRNLGVYEGFVDEIALYLADKSVYELQFEAVVPTKIDAKTHPATRNQVNVMFGFDSRLSSLPHNERTARMRHVFSKRPCVIEDSTNYGCISIRAKQSLSEEELEHRRKVRSILEKLSDDDLDILGISRENYGF